MKVYKPMSKKKGMTPYIFGIDSDEIYTFEGLLMACYTNYKQGLIAFKTEQMLRFIKDELGLEETYAEIKDILAKAIPTSNQFVAFLELSPIMVGKLNEAYISQLNQWDYKKDFEKFKFLGDEAYGKERYIKALTYYKEAQQLHYDGLVDNNIGATYTKLHHYEEAIQYFQKALEYSQAINIKVNLIRVYRIQNKNDKALEKIYEFLEVDHPWELLLEAGDLFMKKSDYTQALTLFLNAYEQNNNEIILSRIIQTRIEIGELGRASQEIEYLKESNEGAYYLLKSKLLMKEDKIDEAIDLLEKGCIMIKDSYKIYLELAKLYRQKNMIISAIKNISMANSLIADSDNETLYEMALIAKAAGNHKDYKEKLNELIYSMEASIRKRLGYD
jgi:tetratricopeptide (TPR) repeat protein